MSSFLEIKCLSPQEQEKLKRRIEEAVTRKLSEGILSEREIREIEEMQLRPLLDIQDVQSVYADFLFQEKKQRGGGEHD